MIPPTLICTSTEIAAVKRLAWWQGFVFGCAFAALVFMGVLKWS